VSGGRVGVVPAVSMKKGIYNEECIMEKTDEEIAKELQIAVNSLNALINNAELRGILVSISQASNYFTTFGSKPTSFIHLKVTKSLIEEPDVMYSGAR
jgi:hypothetical protein